MKSNIALLVIDPVVITIYFHAIPAPTLPEKSPSRVARAKETPRQCVLEGNMGYRSCPLGVATDQHLDSSVARELRVAVCARLYLRRRHSRLDQRVTNGTDTTVAQVLVARVCAARIHGAVDSDSEGWILFQVDRDLRHLARVGSLNVGFVDYRTRIP